MRKGRRFALACWGLLLVGSPAGLEARQEPQDTDTLTVRLTLEEAIERALRHNPVFRRAINDLELNTLDRRERWLDILPTPQMTLLNTTMNWTRQATAVDPFGEPLARDEIDWVQTSRSSQGVGLNLSFDVGELVRLRQQDTHAFGREVAVEAEAFALRAAVSRAFLDLLERMEALALEEEILRTSEANRDLARELYVLALRDRMDLVSLELDAVEQEHVLDENRATVEAARLELRNLIGDPDLGDFDVIPVALTSFEAGPPPLDVEGLVGLALASSPTVRQAQANLEIEQRGVDLVRAQWLPTITMFWNSQRQDFVRGGDAFFDPTPGDNWDASVGLGVSFPDIGQYFRRRIQRQRSAVAVANSSETVRELRNQVEQDVRTRTAELRARALGMELQQRRTALAAERLELAREAYRLGDQSYLELQSAQEQAARAARQYLSTRFSLERVRVELERAVGVPLDRMPRLAAGSS